MRAAAVTGRAVLDGGRAAVRTGVAAEAAGVTGADGGDDADGAADPHAALRQVISRPITALADFARTPTLCLELIFEERARKVRPATRSFRLTVTSGIP